MTPTFKLADAEIFPGGRLQPWRTVEVPWQTFPIASMICEDEVRFLHYLTSRHYTAAGCIVDMGPLAGGSTYAMASGMTAGRIHSYDLWTYCDGFEPYVGAMCAGADLLPTFARNTSEFSGRIVPHKGDILEQSRPPELIEIMFLDAAKSPALMFHIATEFFPHLRQGAYVIHQDFVSAEDPWIHVAMGLLRAYFEVMDSPDRGSVCFRLVEPIPPRPLAPEFFEGGRHLIREARRMLPGWHGLCLELAEAHYAALTGAVEDASAILGRVRAHERYESELFAYDVQLVQRAIAGASARHQA